MADIIDFKELLEKKKKVETADTKANLISAMKHFVRRFNPLAGGDELAELYEVAETFSNTFIRVLERLDFVETYIVTVLERDRVENLFVEIVKEKGPLPIDDLSELVMERLKEELGF